MCGIVGIAASGTGRADPELAERMAATLDHRGPDDRGRWQSPGAQVALAHRRLAILDLSAAGRQPMADASGRAWAVFNGEIYNYRDVARDLKARGCRLRSRCDTEVLVEAYRAWGTECLARLDGMFAFAICDLDERRLFLARDRAGEKPLFYWQKEGRLVFASELKAILEDPSFPRRLDPAALEHYLAYGYVPGEQCLLAGVRKLPPASAMTWSLDDGRQRLWRYWRLPPPEPGESSPEELLEELESLLAAAVRRQLVADVPVGILLSGGVDSSLVTALAARAGVGPVRTFTVTFPGHAAYDEAPYARRVARAFATEHTELAADSDCLDLLPELARQYDEPIGDSSLVATFLVSRLIREHAKVALGGDGGDELFGGYSHYRALDRRLRLPRPLRRLAAAGARRLPLGLRGRNALLAATLDPGERLVHPGVYFDAGARRRLLAPARRRGFSAVAAEEQRAAALAGAGTLLRRATAMDFNTYLPDDILVKVDRASMAVSLEVRSPWLDHRLCELAFARVPDHLKATAAETKILPRRLARRLLPEDLDLERKQGFSLPLASWFRGAGGTWVREVLGEAEPRLFDRREVMALVARQRIGFSHTARLFALTMFELWRRHYRVEPG